MQFTAHTQTFPTTWASEHCKGPSKMHLRTAKRAKAVCTNSPPQSHTSPPKKNPSQQPFKGFELRCQGIISKWHLQVIRGQRIILVTCGKGGKLQGQIFQYLKCRQMFCLHKKCHLIYDGALHPELQLSQRNCREHGWEWNQKFIYYLQIFHWFTLIKIRG